MNDRQLCQENEQYRGTAGVSENNRCAGFAPAFRDEVTGRVELARLQDGSPASLHVMSWLPREWAVVCDDSGAIIELRDGIVSGFVKDGRFYTREEAGRSVGG